MTAAWQSEEVILASGSSARRKMLESAGLKFAVDKPDVDEAAIKNVCRAQGKTVEETALKLAETKAQKVAPRHKGTLVLGSDQMLECEGKWFDKAQSEAEAIEQLRFLSGKTHRLITAATLVRDEKTVWQKTEIAELQMRPLSEDFINAYCARLGKNLLGTVGCYAVEELGSQLFTHIKGDNFIIMGLPLLALLEELRRLGVVLK